MPLQTEVWIETLQENFFPDNSFVQKSEDDSQYVDNKTVHVPNAGRPSKVQVNRRTKPAQPTERTDQDLTYELDELTSDPVHISHADTVELSYNKRSSIILNDKEEMRRVASELILQRWAKGADSAHTILTDGAQRDAHTTQGTGRRLKMTDKVVHQIAIRMDKQDLPATGRYLIIDSDMYADLLDSLTEANRMAFLASADVSKGTVGRLYNIDIFSRSTVLRMKANGELITTPDGGDATEVAAGFAWQKSCVSRAMGKIEMFASEKDPQYYGDIYSFLMRLGGSHRRYDKKGLFLIAEGNV
jgi:hypothetical protein